MPMPAYDNALRETLREMVAEHLAILSPAQAEALVERTLPFGERLLELTDDERQALCVELDEGVHESFETAGWDSKAASAVNNSGPLAQVLILVDGYGTIEAGGKLDAAIFAVRRPPQP